MNARFQLPPRVPHVPLCAFDGLRAQLAAINEATTRYHAAVATLPPKRFSPTLALMRGAMMNNRSVTLPAGVAYDRSADAEREEAFAKIAARYLDELKAARLIGEMA